MEEREKALHIALKYTGMILIYFAACTLAALISTNIPGLKIEFEFFRKLTYSQHTNTYGFDLSKILLWLFSIFYAFAFVNQVVLNRVDRCIRKILYLTSVMFPITYYITLRGKYDKSEFCNFPSTYEGRGEICGVSADGSEHSTFEITHYNFMFFGIPLILGCHWSCLDFGPFKGIALNKESIKKFKWYQWIICTGAFGLIILNFFYLDHVNNIINKRDKHYTALSFFVVFSTLVHFTIFQGQEFQIPQWIFFLFLSIYCGSQNMFITAQLGFFTGAMGENAVKDNLEPIYKNRPVSIFSWLPKFSFVRADNAKIKTEVSIGSIAERVKTRESRKTKEKFD